MLLRLLRRAWTVFEGSLSLVELLVIGVLLVMLLSGVIAKAARCASRAF
jgi:hypothetical protein